MNRSLLAFLLITNFGCDDADSNEADAHVATCAQATARCAGDGSVTADAKPFDDGSLREDGSLTDGAVADSAVADSGEVAPDAAALEPDAAAEVAFEPVGSERAVDYGWIANGQPTEARIRELVAAGARIISLRHVEEEFFDEAALIESLGGTFIRYATSAPDYQNEAFREGMFDLYDAQIALGGPVYLHCASSNRVGASWALFHGLRRGVPPEQAIELGRDAGLSSLEPMVRDLLGL